MIYRGLPKENTKNKDQETIEN